MSKIFCVKFSNYEKSQCIKFLLSLKSVLSNDMVILLATNRRFNNDMSFIIECLDPDILKLQYIISKFKLKYEILDYLKDTIMKFNDKKYRVSSLPCTYNIYELKSFFDEYLVSCKNTI